MAEADKDSSSMAPQETQVLYMTSTHRVTKARYVTSSDPRGYVPVYEYPLNGQWIMMDTDDGYVLWTGIWKADIVKILESQPDLASKLRRVRGGYLKMQGTWMARDVALELARRVAWNIRYDLVPLFGPTFPDSCLSPDQPGYGKVVTRPPNKQRRSRRSSPPAETLFDSPIDSSPAVEAHPPRERSMSHSSGQVQYPQWSGSLGAIKQEYDFAQYGYTQPQTQTQTQPPPPALRRGSVPHLGGYTPQYNYPDVPKHEPERRATQDSGYGSFSPVEMGYPYSQYPTQELAPERSQQESHYPQYTQSQGYSSAPAQTVSFSQQQTGYEQQYEQPYEQQYEQYPQSYQSPSAQSGSIQQYPVGVPTYEYGYNYPDQQQQQQQQQQQGDARYRYGGQY